MKGRRRILDYSSPAEERRRDQRAEQARREALERYNESTFGERRPIASMFLRLAGFIAIASVAMWFLPRRAWALLALLLVVAFVVWEGRRDRWSYWTWMSFRHRWRWW